MKKLGLTFAAIGLLFATTTQAQVPPTSTETQTEERRVEKDDYEKIEVTELPAAVSTAITTDYSEAQTREAWVKEKEDGKRVYKIKLDVNGQEETVYADSEGNWIDKDDKKDE